MKNKSHLNLSKEALINLKKITYLKSYDLETPLHYKGQTPIVAYFIIKGNILLKIGAKTHQILSTGTLLGFYELHFTKPTMFTAVVQKHTEIGYIDKSTLFKIKKSKNKKLQQLYLELTNFPLYI